MTTELTPRGFFDVEKYEVKRWNDDSQVDWSMFGKTALPQKRYLVIEYQFPIGITLSTETLEEMRLERGIESYQTYT